MKYSAEKVIVEQSGECAKKCIGENDDVIHLWEPLKFEVGSEYKYIENGKIFNLFSNLLYYGVAFPVLTIFHKIVYDFKIEGKENIKNLKTGAISVSNHVLFLDCSMIGIAFGTKKVYYTTREGSFKIPFVRKLIKLLRAMPIPKDVKNKLNFVKAVDGALQGGKIIHFYPEAALWNYYEEIRNFKNGAFDFAVRNEVPIVPLVITFREPNGFRKILKKKKDVTLTILEPVYSKNHSDSLKKNVVDLKNGVHKMMKENVEKKKK